MATDVDPEIAEAAALADRLRREQDGIAAVELFLDRGGRNACVLRDGELREVAHGESGRSLLEAIQGAERVWRVGNYLKSRGVLVLAHKAAISFSGGSVYGVFNTASFQAVIKRDVGMDLWPDEAVDALEAEPRIVRLKGGGHWYILPEIMERFQGDED